MTVLDNLLAHRPDDMGGLNNFVEVDGTGEILLSHTNQACFSDLMCPDGDNNLEECYSLCSYVRDPFVTKESLSYSRWLIEESPFRRAYIKGLSPLEALVVGVAVDTTRPSGEVATALLAHRVLWEYVGRVEVFHKIVEAGYDGNLASIAMWLVHKGPYDHYYFSLLSDGHTPFELSIASQDVLANYYKGIAETDQISLQERGGYDKSFSHWGKGGSILSFVTLSNLVNRVEAESSESIFGSDVEESSPLENFFPMLNELKRLLK